MTRLRHAWVSYVFPALDKEFDIPVCQSKERIVKPASWTHTDPAVVTCKKCLRVLADRTARALDRHHCEWCGGTGIMANRPSGENPVQCFRCNGTGRSA